MGDTAARVVLVVAVSAALVLGDEAHAAAADPPPSRPALAPWSGTGPRADDERRWYGYQIMLGDAAGLGIVALGAGAESVQAAWVGVGALWTGPMIAHFAHRHVGRGFADFGLRFGLSIAGGALGLAIGCSGSACSGDLGGIGQVAYAGMGAGVGLLSAMIIDWAVLSWDRPRSWDFAQGARPAGPTAWAPRFSIAPWGGSVGLGGAF
ncbi:MAG TPA: hypothetical protein PLR99_18715 [Polyangiaceae bacterium]|nr:hypothetical protein [Polyangiaceae bacterium]